MNANDPLGWADHGACAGVDQDLFFPCHDITRDDVDLVRPYCQACPVFTDCHTWAIAHETEGIWAATTPADRRRLRRTLRIAGPPVDVDLAMATEPVPDLATAVSSYTADGYSAEWIADVLGVTKRTVTRRRAQARKAS